MKISVIISTLLIAQVSGSFFDVFQGAVLSVQNSFGKLFSDVVTDVKDTVDCTILAVEHVLSLSADATTRYYDKCGTGNKTSTTADTQKNGPQAVEITIETNNEEYFKREIPQEIDAKINETLSRLFHGRNSHDELEGVEKELARETERLAEISGLIKLELEKISSDIHVDFKNIEQKTSKPSVDNILEQLKLLEAIERNINDSSEANKIHQIIDNILLKLKNIEDSEAKENDKVDGILKDIENNTNKTYRDIWDQLNDWKREEARHINLIQNKMDEHDKSPEHVVYVQNKDLNNQPDYKPNSTNDMSPVAPMTSIDTSILTQNFESTTKSIPGSSYLTLAQPPSSLPPPNQNTGRLLSRSLGEDDSLNDDEALIISILTTPLSSTVTEKPLMLVTQQYTTPRVLNQETISTKVSYDDISNTKSTINSMILKTTEVTTLPFKQLTSTPKIVSQQSNISPEQTSVTETTPVFTTSSYVNEEKQLQASPSRRTELTLRTNPSITTQKPQIRITTQIPSETLESIAYLPITTSAITIDAESTTSKSSLATTINTNSATNLQETTSSSITKTLTRAQATIPNSTSSLETRTSSNPPETSTSTLSAPEFIKTTTTNTAETTSAPKMSTTTTTTSTSASLTITSVPDTTERFPEDYSATSTASAFETTTFITSAPETTANTTSNTGMTTGMITTPSAPETTIPNIASTSAPKTIITATNASKPTITTTSVSKIIAAATSTPETTISSTLETTTTTTKAPKSTTTTTNAPETTTSTTRAPELTTITTTSASITTSTNAPENTFTTTTAPESTSTTTTNAPRTTTTNTPKITTNITKVPETTTNAPETTTNTTRATKTTTITSNPETTTSSTAETTSTSAPNITTTTTSTPKTTTTTTTSVPETTTSVIGTTTIPTTRAPETTTSVPKTTTLPNPSVPETTTSVTETTTSVTETTTRVPEAITVNTTSVPESLTITTTYVPETTTTTTASAPETITTTSVPETTTSAPDTTTSVTETTTITTSNVPKTTTLPTPTLAETTTNAPETTTSVTETTTSVTETTTRVPETTTITSTSVPETTTITTTSVPDTTTITTTSVPETTTITTTSVPETTTITTLSAPETTMPNVLEEAITDSRRANMDIHITNGPPTERPRTTRATVPTPSLNAFLEYIDRIRHVTTPRTTHTLLPKFISSHNFRHPNQGKPSAHMTRDSLLSSHMFRHSLPTHSNSVHPTISPLAKFMQHHPSDTNSFRSMLTPDTLPIPATYSAPIPYARNSNLPPPPTLIPQSVFNQNPPHFPSSKNVNRPPDFLSRRSLQPVKPTTPKTNNFDDPDYDSFFHMPPKNSKAHQQALREARKLITNSKQAHNVINSFLNKKKKGINPFNRAKQLKIGK